MDEICTWLETHGQSLASLKKYQVSYDEVFNRLVIPVHGPDDQFAFDIHRNFDPVLPRYKYQPLHARTSYVLYGLRWARPLIADVGYCVAAEGFSDALALLKSGIPAVACLTSSMSSVQAQLLHTITDNVFIFGDGDAPGREFAKSALKPWPFQATGVTVSGFDPAYLSSHTDLWKYIHTANNHAPQYGYIEMLDDGRVSELVERALLLPS